MKYKIEEIETDDNNRQFKYRDCLIKIMPDENTEWLSEDLENDESAFLVNYHRDFDVRRDEIITEDDVREIGRAHV